MKNLDTEKKIVVLIDSDNTTHSKIKPILDEISTHGHIVIKRAYGDWSGEHLKKLKDILNELAVQPVQQFAYTTGKNSTDISMVIDAMDLMHTGKYDAFALVSSDSDFTKLASRIREEQIIVFGFGEKKTPISFRNACDDFVFIENLGKQTEIKSPKLDPKKSDIKEIVSLLIDAWNRLKDEDGWANAAQAGNLLKRQKPDFDPRTYGVSKIPQLISKLTEDFELKKFKEGNATVIEYKSKTAV